VVDSVVAKEVEATVVDYYKGKLNEDVRNGDGNSAEQTIIAAKTIGGTAAVKILEDRDIQKTTSSIQIASDKEREGFQNLVNGEYDNAIRAFMDAENALHGYHCVYELSRLLKTRRKDFADPKKKRDIFQQIDRKYGFGAPTDLLEQVRQIGNE
jgi:hypothetical protein